MNDTIAAISTPYGRGGIAVIRISGEGAIACADGFFVSASGRKLNEQKSARVLYGNIMLDGERIDDGCATLFRAPNSYTGEDTVEISCHGGILVTQKVLSAAFTCGARPALAGEFSRRAFISGNLSLAGAEAVMDIIDAESDDALKVAAGAKEGILSEKINSLREEVISLLSQIYVLADYPEEDLADVTSDEMRSRLSDIADEIAKILKTYSTARTVAHGISAVICGRPNTGKSSLLNRILGKKRAIVTDIAGTTRDTIEASATLGRVPLRLIDTAGLHDTDDPVEKEGVERSRQSLEEAELILAVFDGSRALTDEDREVLDMLAQDKRDRTVIIINKCDREIMLSERDFTGFDDICRLSCVSGDGFERLTDIINDRFIDGSLDLRHDAVVSNARQFAALKGGHDGILRAMVALDEGQSPDIAGLDLELAAGALGELDGRSVGEEIVTGIFSRFCVGK